MLGYYQLDPYEQTNQNTKFFIQEKASENIVCEMVPFFVQGRVYPIQRSLTPEASFANMV